MGMLKRVKFLAVLLLFGCSPKTDAPQFENAPPASLNTEACKSASLNFHTLTAQNMRGIVNCLNGSQNSLQAYKDFLDTASTEDLNLVLDAFNYYMPWGSERHKQFLDLIKILKQKGFLQGFLNQVQVLGESKFLHELVHAALPVWEENSVYNPEPELEALYKYVAGAMEQGLFDQWLLSFEMLSAPQAQLMAALVSSEREGSFNSDVATDLIANLLIDMFKDGSFRDFTEQLAAPEILKTFSDSIDSERQGFSHVFSYAALRSEDDFAYLKRAQKMIASIEQPVTCFKNQPGQRRAESLLKFLIAEVKGKTEAELNEFWLKTVPLLFATGQGLCSIPPYTIANYDVVTDMVKVGHGKAYADFWILLSRNPKFETLVSSLKSVNYVKAAPLINEVAQREVLKIFTDWLAANMNQVNAEALGKLLADISRPDLNKSFVKVFDRVLKSKNREALKQLSKSLVVSWADPRGGLGELLKVVSDSSKISGNKPVIEFFTLLFKDKDMINKTSPPFIRLVKNPHFEKAIDLTAKLSGNGELAKLIVFMADLLRNGGGVSQNLQVNNNLQYSSSVVAPGVMTQNKTAYPLSPLNFGQFAPCLEIKGGLFESSGNNLYKAAQCFNFEGKNPELLQIVDILKERGLLGASARLLAHTISESPHVGSLLEHLETLLNRGLLTKLLKIYAGLMGTPLINKLDPLSYAVFNHASANDLLVTASGFLSRPNAAETLSVLSDVAFKNSKKLYQSQNAFRLKVKDPAGIKKQISDWNPNLSAAQVEELYQIAKENFETHNDAWLYQEGTYKKQNITDFKNEFYNLLSDLLRSNSLEEFIYAFQDYAKDKSALEFVKYLSDWQMVALNYSEDGTARVRIQTGLDALENLVLNSNFGYVYMDHIGLSFQIAVVNSNDFVKTMKEQHSLVKLGHDVSGVFGPRGKHYKFKNMLGSFPVLEHIAQNKQLGVLQRLYRAFYNATPVEYRDSQDTSKNYMHAIDKFNRLGFFKNLTMAVQQAKTQGVAEGVVGAVTNLALKIKKEDIPLLKAALQIIISQSQPGKSGPVDKILDLFWETQSGDPGQYEKFKTNLMHIALGQDKVLPTLSPLVKVLPTLLEIKSATRLVELVFSDLKVDPSALMGTGANLMNLTEPEAELLRRELGWILSQKDFENTLKLYLDVYNLDPELVESTFRELRAFAQLNEQPLDLNNTLKESLLVLKSFGPATNHLLAHPQMRQLFIELLKSLSSTGGLKKFNLVLSRQALSGNLERELHFLFDHFKKDALRFKREH